MFDVSGVFADGTFSHLVAGNSQIKGSDLVADETYTFTESTVPAGYIAVTPFALTVTSGGAVTAAVTEAAPAFPDSEVSLSSVTGSSVITVIDRPTKLR